MSILDVFGVTNYDFVPLWKKSLPLAGILSALSAVLLVVAGLNLSIDFVGGGVYEVPVADSVDVADVRSAISDSGARVQIVESNTTGRAAKVTTGVTSDEASVELQTELAEFAGVSTDDVTYAKVSGTWGDQITNKALEALAIFFVAVAAYLAFTLEWRMAVGALVAVIHDLLITAGVYAVTRLEVSPATVIALLTIMGYSLYDTVVVYDRVYENELERNSRQRGYTALVSRSMNDVLTRSVNTTITTVLPVASMLIVGWLILGGTSLRDFAVALFIGLILGTYSSLFVAAPLLAWLKERQPAEIAEEAIKERRQQRARREAEAQKTGTPTR